METENIDAKEYLNKCKIKPGWVKDRDDAMKYAAHIAHRLYQSKTAESMLWEKLSKLHPEIVLSLESEIFKQQRILDAVFFGDKNSSNFTDWDTPTISAEKMHEMFPSMAESEK